MDNARILGPYIMDRLQQSITRPSSRNYRDNRILMLIGLRMKRDILFVTFSSRDNCKICVLFFLLLYCWYIV